MQELVPTNHEAGALQGTGGRVSCAAVRASGRRVSGRPGSWKWTVAVLAWSPLLASTGRTAATGAETGIHRLASARRHEVISGVNGHDKAYREAQAQ